MRMAISSASASAWVTVMPMPALKGEASIFAWSAATESGNVSVMGRGE